jgi:hypothetical protein
MMALNPMLSESASRHLRLAAEWDAWSLLGAEKCGWGVLLRTAVALLPGLQLKTMESRTWLTVMK